MNKIVKNFRFGAGYLIVGILFIIAAFFSFFNPIGNMVALAVVMGAMALVSGVGLVTHSNGDTPRLVVGILEILIGVFLLAVLPVTASVIPYLFAAWFIVHAIADAMTLSICRAFGAGYFVFVLILSLLCVGAGVYLLLHPGVSMLVLSYLMGFYFVLIGIECIMLWASGPSVTMEIDAEDLA